jgi:uncharacterized protein
VLIVVMTALLRLFVSKRLEEQAREHAQHAESGHQHHSAGGQLALRQRLTSVEAWSDVAYNFRNDWKMLWIEITLGFLLAGFIGLLGNDFFNGLFIRHSGHVLRTIENVLLGPVVAMLSFVCSVGNVPLAAVLWSGGISFAGVLAFIFAYGTKFALRITALMFITMVIAALIVDGLFSGLGLIPHTRPSRGDIFGSVKVDYKLVTNILGLMVFATLMGLTMRRGATDPVCGMKVDRKKALRLDFGDETHYFCSKHCLQAYELDPSRYERRRPHETEAAYVH